MSLPGFRSNTLVVLTGVIRSCSQRTLLSKDEARIGNETLMRVCMCVCEFACVGGVTSSYFADNVTYFDNW